MGLISDIVSAWNWLKNGFIDHIQSGNKIAIFITQTVKSLLVNPATGFLLNIADAVTHSQLPTEIANTVVSVIPKILAFELGIQELPANPAEADILAFEQSVLAAFKVTSDASKVYTTLAAQVYSLIKAASADGKVTFGEAVTIVEQAYQDYQADLKNTAATDIGIVDKPPGTVLADGLNIVLPN